MLALTPVAIFLVWTSGHSRAVNAHLEKIRAAGLPIEGKDLASAFPLPPGAEDVTKLWMEGVDSLENEAYRAGSKNLPWVGTESIELPKLGTAWPEISQAESLLNENHFALDRFHEAAALGGRGKFPVDFSNAIATQLPYTQKIRNAARLLRLDFEVKCHRGDIAGAAKTMKTMLVVSRSVELEPTMVSQLVAIAVDHVATSALAEKLCVAPFTDEDLRDFQSRIRQRSPNKNMRTALLGERALGYTMMRNPKLLGEDRPPIPPLNSDVSCYLDLMERYIDAQEEAYPACLDQAQQIDDDLRSMVGDPTKRLTIVYTSLLLPAVTASFEAAARATASLQAADAGIAVEQFRRENGALPQALTDLVPKYLPAMPTDPHTGSPLICKTTDQGFLIYAVGRNRVDDGGNLDPQQTDAGYFFPVP